MTNIRKKTEQQMNELAKNGETSLPFDKYKDIEKQQKKQREVQFS